MVAGIAVDRAAAGAGARPRSGPEPRKAGRRRSDMAKKRTMASTVAAAAALLVIAGAAVSGCGQAAVGGAVPAGNTSSASGTSGQPGPGTTSASPAGVAPTAVRLCSEPGAVRSVRVFRIVGLGEPGPARPLPTKVPAVTVTNRGRVVALARAICALPPMPPGVLSCPVDIGGGFALEFATDGPRMVPVTIRASGCESVFGASVGRPRWIPASPAFWATFARLTGIKAPLHRP